jgi:hypothetical protein
MSTDQKTIGTDPQEQADLERAWRHFEQGTPFEPDLARRIQERAEKMRQENLRRVGYIDEETLGRLLRDEEP